MNLTSNDRVLFVQLLLLVLSVRPGKAPRGLLHKNAPHLLRPGGEQNMIGGFDEAIFRIRVFIFRLVREYLFPLDYEVCFHG